MPSHQLGNPWTVLLPLTPGPGPFYFREPLDRFTSTFEVAVFRTSIICKIVCIPGALEAGRVVPVRVPQREKRETPPLEYHPFMTELLATRELGNLSVKRA